MRKMRKKRSSLRIQSVAVLKDKSRSGRFLVFYYGAVGCSTDTEGHGRIPVRGNMSMMKMGKEYMNIPGWNCRICLFDTDS